MTWIGQDCGVIQHRRWRWRGAVNGRQQAADGSSFRGLRRGGRSRPCAETGSGPPLPCQSLPSTPVL